MIKERYSYDADNLIFDNLIEEIIVDPVKRLNETYISKMKVIDQQGKLIGELRNMLERNQIIDNKITYIINKIKGIKMPGIDARNIICDLLALRKYVRKINYDVS